MQKLRLTREDRVLRSNALECRKHPKDGQKELDEAQKKIDDQEPDVYVLLIAQKRLVLQLARYETLSVITDIANVFPDVLLVAALGFTYQYDAYGF